MAEHDYIIDNQLFPATRTDLNAVFQAIVTNNSKATAPTNVYTGMFWYDTSAQLIKIYNGSEWVTLFPLAPVVTQSGSPIYAGDVGASDSYEITLSPAPTAYTTGQVFRFRANTANTGAASLNVNGIGARTIVKNFNAALANNDILAGQLVEVINDGTNFQLISPVANVAASVSAATQAEMEAASSTSVYGSPGRLQYHPGVAKFWGYVTYSAGVPTLAASHNITSITDTALGRLAITIATDMSSANYCLLALARSPSSYGGSLVSACPFSPSAFNAADFAIDVCDLNGTLIDPAAIWFAGFGDQ